MNQTIDIFGMVIRESDRAALYRARVITTATPCGNNIREKWLSIILAAGGHCYVTRDNDSDSHPVSGPLTGPTFN